LRKFSSNAYEIELRKGFGISPIFNVSDLYPFKELVNDPTDVPTSDKIQWEKELPLAPTKQIESIIDKRITKRTSNKEYFQYLVKWKNQPVKYSTWMTITKISKYGTSIEEIQKKNI